VAAVVEDQMERVQVVAMAVMADLVVQ
jgi:hypothetical protein